MFDLYCPRIIPHHGWRAGDDLKDYSFTSPILAGHSEVPRPEYNYVWNKDGLRSIEFSEKPKIVVLGCSITLGQGLPEDARWTNILEKKLSIHGDYKIGNISYSGASANKLVSSFMGMINQYKYIPKYVLCNFANFERFYFVNPEATYMQDWYINHKQKVSKASAPWDYEEILPYEWVYYQNLDHIKMLEVLCDSLGIVLIWTSWSNNIDEYKESFLQSKFNHYFTNTVKTQFPPDFEFNVNEKSIDSLSKHYAMIGWEKCLCHYQESIMYKEIFNHAYDYHKISGVWGSGAHWPHPGLHYQIHTADLFYEKIVEHILDK